MSASNPAMFRFYWYQLLVFSLQGPSGIFKPYYDYHNFAPFWSGNSSRRTPLSKSLSKWEQFLSVHFSFLEENPPKWMTDWNRSKKFRQLQLLNRAKFPAKQIKSALQESEQNQRFLILVTFTYMCTLHFIKFAPLCNAVLELSNLNIVTC